MENDIRWVQRFQNYSKAVKHLESALGIPMPDFAQRAGIIQFFEMVYELSWKTLKDYSEHQGFMELDSPRSVFKNAIEQGIIGNGHQWMSLIQDRNLSTHIYDEDKLLEIELLIRNNYFPLFKELWTTLQLKLNQD